MIEKHGLRMQQTIKVPCVNLMDFLAEHGIDHIDHYVSDIQGMDLTVLKTLAPMIEQGRITAITSEVAKDGRRNIYGSLPSNEFKDFQVFLGDRYELVAQGWGQLTDGVFADVPEEWWEMDCRWRLKKRPELAGKT